MNQSTSPLPVTHRPKRSRSGWLLRLLFMGVFVLLGVELITVAWLVGSTLLGATGGAGNVAAQQPETAKYVVPGQPNATADPADALGEGNNVWDEHGPINILLLGVDADDCANPMGGARRTDTMILVRVDPQTKRAAMLSIPRDLLVYIDGYGAKKINTAHMLGASHDPDDPAAGPRLLRQTIQDNLGLSVHRYVRVDFDGLKKMIDEGFGGLTMDLPPSKNDPTISLYDDQYPDGHCGTMTIEFKPGKQKLSGDEVLQYARSRKSTSDFDRSRRQMEVLMAMRDAATSPSVIIRAPKLISALLDTVDTDLSNKEILSLARIGRGMSSDDIIRLRIDENAVYDDMLMIDGVPQWVLVHRQDKLDELVERFRNLEGPQETAASSGTPVATPEP
jgi:LCP family protein required for cell wall assembly